MKMICYKPAVIIILLIVIVCQYIILQTNRSYWKARYQEQVLYNDTLFEKHNVLKDSLYNLKLKQYEISTSID